jgi:aspartyl-tRNA synthetase
VAELIFTPIFSIAKNKTHAIIEKCLKPILSHKFMKRTKISDTVKMAGQEVTVAGWVAVRRDMGKLIFIDLRDVSGILQVVFVPGNEELMASASRLRSEWVVEITGKIKERPKKMANDKISTGSVEMEALKINILNEAQTLPFDIDSDGRDINEEIRMKYKYLDLRRDRVAQNIKFRHKILKFMRDYMDGNGFYEIETPDLTKGTPEGAREFLVPSRLQPGKFYVLPQSPQQFKQLLMVAGFEKYFQVARCFRDEDQRGDRQPEFTQLDVEMSFIEQEDVLQLMEGLMIELVGKLYPAKHITQIPFPRLTWEEAMKKYNSDKPDLRKDKNDPDELAFMWVVDFPMFSRDKEGNLGAEHHPFTSPKKEDISMLASKPESVKANAYDIVLNGYEIGGGSIRIHDRDIQHKVFEILGVSEDDIQRRFGHMLEAFTFGAPPHGGIALGVDRIVAILQNEPNIREIMAFPKTGDARDLMMGSPSDVDPKAIKEANIKIA